jgi:hypothetical protein
MSGPAKSFFRLGWKIYSFSAIREIVEEPLHDGGTRGPIPLRAVTLRFLDGTEERFEGEGAKLVASFYQPLTYTLLDRPTSRDDVSPEDGPDSE